MCLLVLPLFCLTGFETLQVDLGTSQNISQVTVAWNAYFATGYTIQISNNNSSWSTVFSTSSGDGGNDVVPFNTVQARYVRLNSTSWNDSAYHNWINEFEIYAATATAPSPTLTSMPPTLTATSTALPTNTRTSMPANTMHVGALNASSTPSGSK